MRLILALLMISSCTRGTPKMYPSLLEERATLEFEANKKTHYGTAVIPRASRQVIRFKVPPKTKELAVSTCHRKHFSTDKKTQHLFKPRDKYYIEYEYIPVAFLENWHACFMVASAHTSDGKREFALIDFRNNETLEGDLYCNAKKTTGKSSLCQAPEGSTQMIWFKNRVTALAGETCKASQPLTERGEHEGWSFYITVQKGYCVYMFFDDKKEHRLTMYGY